MLPQTDLWRIALIFYFIISTALRVGINMKSSLCLQQVGYPIHLVVSFSGVQCGILVNGFAAEDLTYI